MEYQTYLPDCEHTGVIMRDGIILCRWCRKPYAKVGITHYEERHFNQPLFRTDDGKDIYEGDEYFFVVAKNPDFVDRMRALVGSGSDQFYKYFSTEKAANEYILTNKPCLSVNDVASIKSPYWSNDHALNELKELAKSKLKNK